MASIDDFQLRIFLSYYRKMSPMTSGQFVFLIAPGITLFRIFVEFCSVCLCFDSKENRWLINAAIKSHHFQVVCSGSCSFCDTARSETWLLWRHFICCRGIISYNYYSCTSACDWFCRYLCCDFLVLFWLFAFVHLSALWGVININQLGCNKNQIT